MKKSTLALSIAAAIGGLGLAGNALAITDGSGGSITLQGAGTNASMYRNDGGIGHQLVFPYFTAQGANATLLTITNTDTANGKLVKVRFRGAANSDDLYDFQIALSPGDIWTAGVTKDATSGAASLSTSDKSCTLPVSVSGTFNLQRVDGGAAAQTLEGYVEVINMADILPNPSGSTVFTTGLYTAIKHVSGVAPCTAAVLTDKLSVDNTYAQLTAAQGNGSAAVGLAAPTTGLTGDWIILNQTTTAAWSGAATALEVRNSATQVATTGNLVFWPQTAGKPAQVTAATTSALASVPSNLTADPLLTTGVVAIQNFDLPDLSTVYVLTDGAASPTNITTAALQADDTTSTLAVTSVANQFLTDTGVAAVTDILFSQPMRRYSAAVNYKANKTTDATTGISTTLPFASTGSTAVALFRGAAQGSPVTGTAGTASSYNTSSSLTTAVGAGSAYYAPANLVFPTGVRNLCLNSIAAPAKNFIFDREETTPAASTTSTAFVISPATTTTVPSVYVCGEAAVISINNGGTTGASALSASLARSDFTSSSLTTYANGWVKFLTPGATATGLPIIGQSFIRVANGAVNYGIGYTNKVTR